jgi:hypothetical protein
MSAAKHRLVRIRIWVLVTYAGASRAVLQKILMGEDAIPQAQRFLALKILVSKYSCLGRTRPDYGGGRA